MKKDLSSKEITKCKDVFSDICNVNLFSNGKDCPLIRPEELEQMPTDIVYRDGQGKLKEHRMDVRMKRTISNTSIALFCIMARRSGREPEQ